MRAITVTAAVSACIAIQCLSVAAHETKEKSPAPGFRPECEQADAFCAAVKTATITVYPSIVRTMDGTTWSTSSQHRLVAELKEQGITTAVADAQSIDPGELVMGAQWALFNKDMETIAKEVKQRASGTPYHLVLEFLVGPRRSGGENVGGIHCFILDPQGRNAFSFLLNSHHKLFVDAELQSDYVSDMSRETVIAKCTSVALTALHRQLHAMEHSD